MPSRRQHGEGSLFYRQDKGHWVARAEAGWKPNSDGRVTRHRPEFTGKTPAEAIAKREEWLARRRDGFTLPRGRQPTVGEWVLHWCHHTAKASVDPNTWHRSYRQKCEDYIAPYFAKVRLPDLACEDVEAWHAALLQRPRARGGGTLSPSTVVTAHRIFSSALNEAVRRGRIAFNPASLVRPPKAARPAIEPPTAEELDMVLAACRDWPNGARWVLAVTTGLRQGEALGLRWRDVRLRPPASVTVRRVTTRIEGEWVEKDPKSEKSKRPVPLPKVAADALAAHKARQQVTSLDGLVFTRPGGQPVHAKSDWEDWQALLASLGLPAYRVHDLRHAYATELLEQGEDSRVVQDLMGWSSAKMTEVYQHVRPAVHARVVARLDERFGS